MIVFCYLCITYCVDTGIEASKESIQAMIKAIIVEDDPMVSFINKNFLGRMPGVLNAGAFDNAGDALAFLEKNDIDLIILDMYLPDMTGLDMLRKLRSAGDSTEVIMVTAANSFAEINSALSLGVLDYLVKPFEYDRFCLAISKYLTKHEKDAATETLSQEEIDRMLSAGEAPSPSEPVVKQPEKGIQNATLESLLTHIPGKDEDPVSCEVLSEKAGLSKVTIRRYMNYLIENDRAESIVDYQTGGRPKITYRLTEK